MVVQTAGYQPPKDFASMMQRVLDLKHLPEWQASLASHPDDASLLAKIGMAQALKGDQQGATDTASKAMALSADAKAGHEDDLASLYNAVGDSFQNDNKFDKAIPYFEAAANTGKDPSKIAYGITSEAICYLSLQPPQPAKALEILKRGDSLQGLSKDDADMIASLEKSAQQMLNPPKKP